MENPLPQKPADMIRPPFFENGAASDNRRWEFDFKNGVLITNRTPVDVVFIGDSITHFWELNAYFRRFGLVVNRGIGGDVADILVQRFEGDALQLKPHVCVAMVGINNTWCLDDPEHPADPDDVFTLVTDSYRRMLEMAKEYRVPLLFCSVLPVGDRSESGRRRNRLVLRINQKLKVLCEEFGVTYVDYHSAVVDKDGLTMLDGLSDDTLHPHVIGYNRMAAVITPLLEKVLADH